MAKVNPETLDTIHRLAAASRDLTAKRAQIDEERRELNEEIARLMGFDKESGQQTLKQDGVHVTVKRTPSISVSREKLEALRERFPAFPAEDYFRFDPKLKMTPYKASPEPVRALLDEIITTRPGYVTLEVKALEEVPE